MKRTLARLAGLLIILALVLSGCNLIGTDRMMELDQQFAALKEKYSGVVATYEGGEITCTLFGCSLSRQNQPGRMETSVSAGIQQAPL